MDRPPIAFDLPEPMRPPIGNPTEPALPRMIWAWIVFILFMLLLIPQSLRLNDANAPSGKDVVTKIERKIGSELGVESLMSGFADTKKDKYNQDIQDLADSARIESKAQKLRIVLCVEDKKPVVASDLTRLAKSKNPENVAFSKLYATPRPSKDEAMKLLESVKGDTVTEKLARVQVKEMYGDKAARAKEFKSAKSALAMIFGVAAMGGMVLGVGAWILYGVNRSSGKWKPKGIPLRDISLGQADRLIFLVVLIFLTYLGMGIILVPFGKKIDSIVEYLVFLPIFLVIYGATKFKIFGWQLTFEKLGISKINLKENALWAGGAFIANIPVLLVVLAITLLLEKFLPGGSHPAAEELLNHPGAVQIINIFVLACIIAPMWEEVCFRGLIFPAIAKVTGKPILGAILSSFVFASIHPQGLAGIFPLMSVALMMCAVSNQTKSLVGNIMLHALHNGATLGIALLVATIR